MKPRNPAGSGRHREDLAAVGEMLAAPAIGAFVADHVEGIVRRPLLIQGMLLVSNDPQRAAAHRGYLILVDEELDDGNAAHTILHELIHLGLLLRGVDRTGHDEGAIENLARGMLSADPSLAGALLRAQGKPS